MIVKGAFKNYPSISRRDFIKLGGGLLASAAIACFSPGVIDPSSELITTAGSQQIFAANPDIHLAVCAGFLQLPERQPASEKFDHRLGSLFNHNQSPLGFSPGNPAASQTIYTFGFRDVTGMPEGAIQGQDMHLQTSPPLLWVNQGEDYLLILSNLDSQIRSDWGDSSEIYWQGFSNTCLFSESRPPTSMAVPVGKSLALNYKPNDPGTFVYRCCLSAREHVHLRPAGIVYVRPSQNGDISLYPSGLFAYNDQDGSTGYDREFALNLSEIRSISSWDHAELQPDNHPSDKPDLVLLNGRVYPDTLIGNEGEDINLPGGYDLALGNPSFTSGRPDLGCQPTSSLIEAESGERILVRFANLTCQRHAMKTAGLKMKIIARNATHLRHRDGTDLTSSSSTVSIGPSESCDVILIAPRVTHETRFLLYSSSKNAACTGNSGLMTEIRIHPPGTLTPQTKPNTNPRLTT